MEKFQSCVGCPLLNASMFCGTGADDAQIAFVGEGTLPFRAQKLIDTVLHQANIEKHQVYMTNAVICGTSAPKPKEIKCCKQRLHDELLAHKPRVIVALGKIAVKSLLGLNKSIKEERGTVIYADHLKAFVVITYHPSAILRTARLHRDLLSDVQKAKELLNTDVEVKESIIIDYQIITDKNQLMQYLQKTNRHPTVALDVETAGDGDLLCLGLSTEPCKAVVLADKVLQTGRSILDVWFADKICIGHNIKSDINVLRKHGYTSIPTGRDTMLQSYTAHMFVGGHGLKHLVREHLHFYEDYSAPLKKFSHGYEHCPADVLHRYNAYDAGLTLLLDDYFEKVLDKDDQRVLQNILYPASDALCDMEYVGVHVDVPYLRTLDDTLGQKIQEAEAQLYALAGETFNLNSPKQLIDVMYTKMELPVPMRVSTDVDALETLVRFTNHSFPKLLLQHRKLSKLRTTYAQGLLKAVDSQSRVRTTFNQHTTVTGRLSSSKPLNLQNIARDDEIRNIFSATPGYTMIEIDETQAEVRAWAWLSRDAVLQKALLSGTDIHIATACLMFGLTPDQVSKTLRTQAKRLTFGTLFMMTAETLAFELEISVAEAQELQRKFFSAYHRGREWISEMQQHVLQCGYFNTIFGRKLRYAHTMQNTQEVLRQAVNYPIQNLASDITMLALIRLHKKIKRGDYGNTRLILTVHDSIMLETLEKDIIGLTRQLKADAEQDVLDGWMPFLVEAKTGLAWGKLELLPSSHI